MLTMTTLVWRSLLVLSLTWICLGDNVEVSANGDTAMSDCTAECAQLVEKSSTALEQRVASMEQIKADLEKSNAELLTKAQSFEISVTDIEKQLQSAIARAETAESQQSNDNEERLVTLRSQVSKAAELQRVTEERSNECTSLLDSVIEREKQFKQETDAHFQSFRAEIEDLTSHKHKASEMAGLLDDLKKDLDMHKTELTTTRDSLTKDLEDHRTKLRETADSHTESRKELFAANARIRELHDQVSTTYINTTLIQADTIVGAKKAVVFSVACCVAAKEAAAPYWAKFLAFVDPLWNDAVLFYKQAVLPQIQKASNSVSDAYKQHAKPTLDEHVFPLLEPVMKPIQEYLGKLRIATARGLQQGSQSLLHYLELMETANSPFRERAVASLKFTEKNSVQALDTLLKVILILFALRLVWPKRKKRQVEPGVKVGSASPGRKGLRVRSTRTVAAPTQ